MAQLSVQQGGGQVSYTTQPYIVDSLLQMDMKGVGSFYYENFVSISKFYIASPAVFFIIIIVHILFFVHFDPTIQRCVLTLYGLKLELCMVRNEFYP